MSSDTYFSVLSHNLIISVVYTIMTLVENNILIIKSFRKNDNITLYKRR